MATLNQINASRKNGARSKGPVTPEGKARVAQNGTKHGVYSKRVVLQNEDPAAYMALREALLNDWGPTSAFEHNLIVDIAEARWRLSRFTTLETAAYDYQLERMRPEIAESFEHIDEGTRTVLAFNSLLMQNRTLTVLQSAILHQHRVIDRATSQLLRLRKIRPDGDNRRMRLDSAVEEQEQRKSTQPAAVVQPEPAAAKATDTASGEIREFRKSKPEQATAPGPCAPATALPATQIRPAAVADTRQQGLGEGKVAA